MAKSKLRIIPIGGSGEIGKNMTLFEYDNKAIVIDAGIMFPANDMHGVDYIIPDFQFLTQRKDLQILGIFFTHGHEDHIGAVNHFVEAFPKVPIYATRLTAGLIEIKLRNNGTHQNVDIKIIKPDDRIVLQPFTLEPFHVCHSIPDCVGFGITTPHGLIVHTGDYKFDNTPVHGAQPDYAKLADFGQRGVRLLMADSTNADRAGWTPSESTIEPAFERVFANAKGRILVATFASLISRIQLTARMAQKYGRRIAISGHTMKEYVKLAREIGYIDIPDELLIDPSKMNSIEPHKLVVMVTGSQGEPSAVLSKMATGKHRAMEVQRGDTIVLSSHPIPGNEETVYRTINKLFERGANVIYDSLERVHVSGHACQEEMRLMIALTRPEYIMPVHGELRHLIQHGKLAMESGVAPQNVLIGENGTVLEMDRHSIRKGERIPGGYIFVDGSSVGDIGKVVIRDREILAQDGFLLVSVRVNKQGQAVSEPEIVSRGFIYLRDSDDLLSTIKSTVTEALRTNRSANGKRREAVEESISRVLYNETKRRPMVFSIINEV